MLIRNLMSGVLRRPSSGRGQAISHCRRVLPTAESLCLRSLTAPSVPPEALREVLVALSEENTRRLRETRNPPRRRSTSLKGRSPAHLPNVGCKGGKQRGGVCGGGWWKCPRGRQEKGEESIQIQSSQNVIILGQSVRRNALKRKVR